MRAQSMQSCHGAAAVAVLPPARGARGTRGAAATAAAAEEQEGATEGQKKPGFFLAGLFGCKVESEQPARRHRGNDSCPLLSTPNLHNTVAPLGSSASDFVCTHSVLLAPLCTHLDLAALGCTERQAQVALSSDFVWQQVLAKHFPQPLTHLVEHLNENPEVVGEHASGEAVLKAPMARRINSIEALAAQLPNGGARQLYPRLVSVSSTGAPSLSPKARLILEVHELQEWTQLRRRFVAISQAATVAEVIGWKDLASSVRDPLEVDELRFLSLQEMAGSRATGTLLRARSVDEHGSPANRELQRYTRLRMNRRREERRRQIEYLQQDLLGPSEWR